MFWGFHREIYITITMKNTSQLATKATATTPIAASVTPGFIGAPAPASAPTPTGAPITVSPITVAPIAAAVNDPTTHSNVYKACNTNTSTHYVHAFTKHTNIYLEEAEC
ncbi:hypothetical protein BDR06DRAFT_976518 [Suillus hirtellus]|nr:hypothetical protein BDR06DRAFT_976518 [Suillus hirtellus]